MYHKNNWYKNVWDAVKVVKTEIQPVNTYVEKEQKLKTEKLTI